MGPRRKGSAINNVVKSQTSKVTQHQSDGAKVLSPELRQRVLDTFCRAFPLAGTDNVKNVIQDVKGHLYNRDFASAFGRAEYLDAYALRWSASRSLCYAEIFGQILRDENGHIPMLPPEIAGYTSLAHANEHTTTPFVKSFKVVCIGGGAGAEVAAFAAATVQAPSVPAKIEVAAIDIADWSSGLSSLETALTTPPLLSTYASDAVKAANQPLIEPTQLAVNFIHQDILEGTEKLVDLMTGVSLCTIMFTLNELFTTSISRTTAFLLALSNVMEPGAWLLVVDSPGSYSEIKLGSAQTAKQYPMKWLLDHTLLEVVGVDEKGNQQWKKVTSDDSKWYRISSQLKYPIELENMRYQIHLYRKQG